MARCTSLMACVPTHRSAEPNSLAVRVGFDDRAELLAAAIVHDLAAAISATDPKPASGVVAPSGLHGTAMARLGAGGSAEQTGSGDRGIERNSEGGAGEVGR